MRRKVTSAAVLIVFGGLIAAGSALAAEDRPEKAAGGQKPAKAKVLFANEEFYLSQAGKEQAFEGVLSKVRRAGGGIGFARFNPFRLTMKKGTREVYIGGRDKLLDPYVGRRVRIVGKPLTMEVEGNIHNEVWPASIALLAGGKPVAAASFSTIEVTQTGGFAGVNMQYRITAGGGFDMKSRRRVAKGKLDAKDLKALADAVNGADWAKIPKVLRTKNTADDFEYAISVKIGKRTHSVVCDGIAAQKQPVLRQIVLTLVKIQRASTAAPKDR